VWAFALSSAVFLWNFWPTWFYLFVPFAQLSFPDAVVDGDLMQVKWYITSGRIPLNEPISQTEYKMTPLHIAASAGQLEIVKFLVSRGARLEARDDNTWTPLHYAAFIENPAVIDFLLESGAEVDAADTNGRTALHVSAIKGNAASAQVLVYNGNAMLDAIDLDDMKPMQYARVFDKAEVAGVLEQAHEHFAIASGQQKKSKRKSKRKKSVEEDEFDVWWNDFAGPGMPKTQPVPIAAPSQPEEVLEDGGLDHLFDDDSRSTKQEVIVKVKKKGGKRAARRPRSNVLKSQ